MFNITEIEKNIEKKQFKNILKGNFIYGKKLHGGRDYLRNTLNLNKKESLVIRARFGIGFINRYTRSYLAKKLNLSTSRIQMIENIAFRKLIHPKNKEIIKNYITWLINIICYY